MQGKVLQEEKEMSFGIKRNATDALFSELVRKMADWSCEKCGGNFENRKDIFDCSHFYSRKNKSVRFDFQNVAALCRGCHFYFGEHPAEHSEFFLKKLGQEKFDALRIRAHTPTKIDEKAIRIGLKLMLKKMNDAILGHH